MYPSPISPPVNLISFQPKNSVENTDAFEEKFRAFSGFRFTPLRDEGEEAINKWAKYAYDSALTLGHALDAVVKAGGDVTDGSAVLSEIRRVDFDGATGRVILLENGDR